MKKQDGKTSLEILLTIVILLIVAGAAVAMIFGGTDIVAKLKGNGQENGANDVTATETVQEPEDKID